MSENDPYSKTPIEAALDRFWQGNAVSAIYAFWQNQIPVDLEKSEAALRSQEQTAAKPDVYRLTGAVFEQLALSHLTAANPNPNVSYVGTDQHFDQFKEILKTSPDLKITNVVRKNHFESTRIEWQERYLTIPDGFCFSQDSEGNSELIGMLEAKTRYKQESLEGSLESIWLFTEFLRANPQIWFQLCQVIGRHRPSIAKDEHFKFNLLHIKGLPKSDTDRIRTDGWSPIEVPFDPIDIHDLTIKLLQMKIDQA